jgi:hypothetical protein
MIAIEEIHHELFQGGGSFRKPIFGSLLGNFGTGRFTLREANAAIPEFDRSVCRVFLAAGLIQSDSRGYPLSYHVHIIKPTRKLTRGEILERMQKKGRIVRPDERGRSVSGNTKGV